MNKYRLLRDNKESGPYTVQEIIDKGMKPYDLVWLDGKSAAWRYPSEIEELKEYAPAIEEQPYDRFYKRPAAVKETPVKQDKPARPFPFESVLAEAEVKKTQPAEDEPKTQTIVPSKKVYINFPGSVPKKDPVVTQKKIILPEEKKEVSVPPADRPLKPAVAASPITENAAALSSSFDSPVFPATTRRFPAFTFPAAGTRMFYGVVAACFLGLVLISVFLINYRNQRGSIKELNQLVEQMEKRQAEQNQAAKAALASRVIPAAHVTNNDPVITTGEPFIAPPISKRIPEEKKTNSSNSYAVSANPVVSSGETGKEEKQTANANVKTSRVIAVSNKVPSPNAELYNQVSVKANNYKTGLFGGISGLQFVLKNNSAHALERVAVEVQYFGPEKKLLRTQTVYFENVAPGSEPVLNVPRSARGINIDYRITDIRG